MASFSILGRQITITGPQAQDPGPIRQASPESVTAKPSDVMFTRSHDAFFVDTAWLKEIALNEDSILRKEGAMDVKLWEKLLDDDVAFSAFQQRRLALVSRKWDVEPGDDSAQAKEAADHLRAQIKVIGWDRVCNLMMFGLWFGWAVAEVLFKIGPDQKVWMDEIIVPDRRWFGFTNEGELRMRTPTDHKGLPVPPNKFWAYRIGGTHDFQPYGMGLAHWCYWPIWFKRNVLQFWIIYLEKFGQPTVIGKFPAGATEEEQEKYLAAAKAVGKDSAVIVPEGAEGKLPLETLEAMRSSSGTSSYRDFMGNMDDSLLRVILGQTMTAKAANTGLGSTQGDVQKDVRDEIVQADSDGLHESFNRSVAKWLTVWNFGPDCPLPHVYRKLDDEEDLTAIAERDAVLDGIGIKRKEESIAQVYGDGYEKVEPPAPVMAKPQVGKPGMQFEVHDPAPLYVRRQLLNAKALIKWAKAQGFKTTLQPEDMHVTVFYSKTPVDWFGMPEDYWSDQDGKLVVTPGGPRKVEALGSDGAVVLHFASRTLRYRHSDMVDAGASHDFEEYLPHVTISYDPGEVDLSQIEPFDGPLIFGPEIFEQIKGFDPADLDFIEFSAEDLSAIDELTDRLAEDSNPVFAAMATQLRSDLGGVKTPEGLRIALLQSLERMPVERLAELSALPLTAMRATGEAVVE